MFDLLMLRPDAIKALEDPGVKKALPRYVKVVRDELPAKFLITRKIPVEFDPGMNEEELWEIHDKAMKKFRAIEAKMDSGKIKLEDLEDPKKSLLDLKCAISDKIMTHCHFCTRRCEVNRLKGELGFCKAGTEWRIFGAHEHYGEEAELVISGTIFQAACSMRCVYCQNAPASIKPELGETWSVEEVVAWMETMKRRKVRNINWVGGSPTCWLWHILKALKLSEVNLAQVWNSNSYYSEETAKLIDGVMDVYLLDFRYFSEECAIKLSQAPNYPEVAKRNHLTANKVGELLIRVLIMPTHLECDAKPILKWIRDNLEEWTRVNILPQYRPCWKAWDYPGIDRPLSSDEYEEVVNYAKKIGLKNLVRS